MNKVFFYEGSGERERENFTRGVVGGGGGVNKLYFYEGSREKESIQ